MPSSSVVSIHDIVRSNALVAHFQPILSARRKSLVGFEALARGTRAGADLLPPTLLFDMADAAGISEELDLLCRKHAVSTFAHAQHGAGDVILFLNLRLPAVQAPAALARELSDMIAPFGLSPDRVGLEILESEIEDTGRVRSLIEALRAAGFLIVLDDVGSGHSNLDRIPLIKPDLIKVDRTLVSHIDGDYHKRSAFKSLLDLGRKIGALVVAEGVETDGEAMIALELGADLLQGFLVGRPRDVAGTSGGAMSESMACIDGVARRFRAHMVDAINDRKLQHRRLSVVIDEILGDLRHARADRFDDVLGGIIGQQPDVECVYVLDHAGIQVTETVWNPLVARRSNAALFHAAPKGADHSLKEYYYILLEVELQKYTTEPYVSLASGSVCRTISTYFRDTHDHSMYILCIDVAGSR